MTKRRLKITLLATTCLMALSCDAIRPANQDLAANEIEVALFEGGYGIKWHQSITEQYNLANAGTPLSVRVWGDPRVNQKVKPRILRGTPPDMMHDRNLPIWLLMAQGKLHSFNDALDLPAPGGEGAWRDQFIPGALDTFTNDGQVYAVPSAFNAWVCWYDKRLFDQHGWTVPETWAEFDALCKQIREAGIAPLAYQGKYPIYGWWTLAALIQRVGGLAAVNRINALEPGAFQHEDVVRAARLMQEMAQAHFSAGALAMTHTDSQLQFMTNKAAMIFCGLWLENEMKASTPPEFQLRCFNMPRVAKGKGNGDLIYGHGQEFLLIPTDAPHPEAAADFARYLVSPQQAPSMATAISVISPLADATPRDTLSPAMASALDLIDGSPGVYCMRVERLLLEWRNTILIPQIAALARGDTSPEAFCQALDEGIAAAVARWEGTMPSAIAYDPVRFGEAP
jgi:N-acetylglucosamine transport system substrate-binding protein